MVRQVSWEFLTLQIGNGILLCRDYNHCNLETSCVARLVVQPYLFVRTRLLLSQLGLIRLKLKSSPLSFGAITASIAGSLQAGFIGSVVPKDYTFINSINVFDHCCIWWTWFHYRCHRFSYCSWNFEYASPRCLLAFRMIIYAWPWYW